LVIVVDNNPELQELLLERTKDTSSQVISNTGRGVADARTTAVKHCSSDLVAFIDDDAWAEPNWLAELASVFESADVIGAGGRVVPEWGPDASRIPAELLWLVGATYKGHPNRQVTITRPIGANMIARRDALIEVGGFPSDFGVRDGMTKSRGNEELALFTRLTERFGPDCIMYIPTAVVHHFVPADRTTWYYLVSRSWAEGTSKGYARQRFGRHVMTYDSSYVRDTLVPGAVSYLRGANPSALRSAAMCLTSLAVTVAGYSWQLAFARGGDRRAF
jgi:glycosyltransferase involved in cell wall biosynthesis